mgnify:CR=1 FL=1
MNITSRLSVADTYKLAKANPMPEYKFNEMILSGKRAGAQELEEGHAIVKASANLEELVADTLAFARTFTKKREFDFTSYWSTL